MHGLLYSRLLHALYRHGRIQVLWGLKRIQFLGPSLRTRKQNYEYEIRCKSEYLFRIKKSQQITNLRKLINTTNVTKSRKITQILFNKLQYAPL
jgi:hypothetical protein